MSSAKNETKKRILQSAWDLLEAGQASKVRMSDIAKQAGISRQALYLHYPNRADLLIATTRYIDEVKNTDARLVASRTAKSGKERLDAFVEAWGNYIPEIYGVAKALRAVRETDKEADLAINNRMQAVREGCEAAIKALAKDGDLKADLSQKKATDIYWTLMSINNWELLTLECGWSQKRYIETMKEICRASLVK